MHTIWKVGKPCIDDFKAFRDSIKGLHQEAKTKQTLKCNLFLMIAQRALIKHFKIWMNDLLFLAIYGEGPTGRIVARYLSPPSTTAAIAPGLNEM
jgi:hypothetical protein